MVKKTSLFLGEYDNPAGSVCKAFEQWDHPVVMLVDIGVKCIGAGGEYPVDPVA
jgi:hypothetical protein